MNVEALSYFETINRMSKIPYLGRDNSIRFVESLYDRGAMSVEVSKISVYFIIELVVKFDKEIIRKMLIQCLKARPEGIFESEYSGTRVFNLDWKSAKGLDDGRNDCYDDD